LWQIRQLGVTQYQADIGVGDQPAPAIDDIGVATLTDPQRGDDIPDQLQIDFGDGNPAFFPARTIPIVM
jgi:hypothetical protein